MVAVDYQIFIYEFLFEFECINEFDFKNVTESVFQIDFLLTQILLLNAFHFFFTICQTLVKAMCFFRLKKNMNDIIYGFVNIFIANIHCTPCIKCEIDI